MNKTIIIIGTPFESAPAGGFLRDAKVLPYFSQVLVEEGFNVVLHIPAHSVATSIILLVNSDMSYENAVKIVHRNVYRLGGLGIFIPLLDDSLSLGAQIA